MGGWMYWVRVGWVGWVDGPTNARALWSGFYTYTHGMYQPNPQPNPTQPATHTGLLALRRLRALMVADPVGRAILAERPDIREETVRPEVLRALPEGSFGREYARFMDHHG